MYDSEVVLPRPGSVKIVLVFHCIPPIDLTSIHFQPWERSPPYVHGVPNMTMRGVDATMESPRFGMEVSSNGFGIAFDYADRVLPKNGGDSVYIYILMSVLFVYVFSKMSAVI